MVEREVYRPDPSASRVVFSCALPDEAAEQELRIVGDHPALGCWDVSKSIKLGGDGNMRTSAPVIVPRGVLLQYKYVLCASGRVVRWESIAGNRSLEAVPAELSVCDELDYPTRSAEALLSEVAYQPVPTRADDTVLVVCYILPLVIRKTSVGWAIEWNQVRL
jgi:hypothetical protein